ncbi:MAG TPA: hypothetical protein VJ735_21035, partial [Actinomycetes bacterium]|nr:hypothetical protein [Actinomycetes bacterium]
MTAELAGQRPLLERAAAGDREAFALVYDTQVEGVYRYLLAWTGDPSETAELTANVFHAAMGWLPSTTSPEGEAAAWLTAMTRDALAQHQGPSRAGGPADGAPPEAPGDVAAAVARLREPEREVVVLRLLLGHSLDHTAHLSGYSRRAVLELQLTACLAVHELAGGTHTDSAPTEARPVPSAEEFERRLGRSEIDLTGGDPALADALAVAGSLRRSIPEHVSPPPAEFVARLRAELVSGGDHRPLEPAPLLPSSEAEFWAQLSDPDLLVAPVPARVDAGNPRAARGGTGFVGWLARRPWVATGVATAGIVVVLAVQAFGGQGAPPGCGGRPCPVSTTAAVAAGAGSSVGTPLTTVRASTTTSSTVGADAGVVSPAVPRTSAVTAPPTTR